ncbi:MAG: hypothetical protein U5L00_16145 [Desulfovermiculus sp.]|nr:hypothetical protein [Desulfovermiculus sp.]
MQVQCGACKKIFDLSEFSEEQNIGSARENLCNECLLAHIEMLVYGQGSRAMNQKEMREPQSQEAA